MLLTCRLPDASDRRQRVDSILLRHTIQRQFFPKRPLASAEAAARTGYDLLMVGCKLDGGNMRIADRKFSRGDFPSSAPNGSKGAP